MTPPPESAFPRCSPRLISEQFHELLFIRMGGPAGRQQVGHLLIRYRKDKNAHCRRGWGFFEDCLHQKFHITALLGPAARTCRHLLVTFGWGLSRLRGALSRPSSPLPDSKIKNKHPMKRRKTCHERLMIRKPEKVVEIAARIGVPERVTPNPSLKQLAELQ